MGWYDRRTRKVRDLSCGDRRVYLEFEVRRIQCKRCNAVKREWLDFLADAIGILIGAALWQGLKRLATPQS